MTLLDLTCLTQGRNRERQCLIVSKLKKKVIHNEQSQSFQDNFENSYRDQYYLFINTNIDFSDPGLQIFDQAFKSSLENDLKE